MNKDTVEYDLRIRHPKHGYNVDYGNGRKSAIYLMCLACMGNMISEVSKCTSYQCSLWKFRPGSGTKVRPKGLVPTEQEYKDLMK